MVSRYIYIESNRLNNMPIATAGLATALQDSASALTTANNSIDESIAIRNKLFPDASIDYLFASDEDAE